MSLREMYQQIDDITKPLCLSGQGCGERAEKPYHCCERNHCDAAARFAREGYGIELKTTGHEIPFMGPEGCTVPLHLRPACTIHACVFSWTPVSAVDPHYEQLRQRIIKAESAAGRNTTWS